MTCAIRITYLNGHVAVHPYKAKYTATRCAERLRSILATDHVKIEIVDL
jgi:hypothetical protein